MKGILQRRYSREFREEAVRFVLEKGLSLPETARRLSLPPSTLGNWMRAHKVGKLSVIGSSQNPLTLGRSSHYHPEAMHTIIVKCSISGGKIAKVGYIPGSSNDQNQPEVLKHDERGQQVFEYVTEISRKAGLNAGFQWNRYEVVIH